MANNTTTVRELIDMLQRMPQDMRCVLSWTEYNDADDSMGFTQWRRIAGAMQHGRNVHFMLEYMDHDDEKACEEDLAEFYLQGGHLLNKTPIVRITDVRRKDK